MDNFDYNIKADISPAGAGPGDRVIVTAQISNIVGEINNVYASIPQHGISNRLTAKDNGTYSTEYTIPWMAPSGNYKVNFYATDKDYKRGPSVTIDYRIP